MINPCSYLHRELSAMIMMHPRIQSFVHFSSASYYEVKIDDKYLYIAINDTGLYFVIEAPEQRSIKSNSVFYEEHFRFEATDRIWLANSLASEELGKNTTILAKVNIPEFKKTYGLCYYALMYRLTLFPFPAKKLNQN